MPLTADASIRRKIDSVDTPTRQLREHGAISGDFVQPMNLNNAPCRV
ncbi:hypothetical protein PXO_03300 [Xanthomonas oryzae pv. oryzae PXO99A]|uniref:Uncharacterized protein n=1 Tax=Xanthomonas oryzae pv. oryzae (strain PXO99A) TaxID=360094 RepID=A0A0K0GR84_XANOP|nr:hypothetical protein PXO_03300 [Xanthomonas oryzae pv. oryzae PXO99A]